MLHFWNPAPNPLEDMNRGTHLKLRLEFALICGAVIPSGRKWTMSRGQEDPGGELRWEHDQELGSEPGQEASGVGVTRWDKDQVGSLGQCRDPSRRLRGIEPRRAGTEFT